MTATAFKQNLSIAQNEADDKPKYDLDVDGQPVAGTIHSVIWYIEEHLNLRITSTLTDRLKTMYTFYIEEKDGELSGYGDTLTAIKSLDADAMKKEAA